MKIFIVGDYRTGTGPANVTRDLIKNMPKGTVLYLKHWNKILRAAEILSGMHRCDAVLFSGYSRQNIFGMNLAHIFRRPCMYLMHGCVEHENKINRVPDEKMAAGERKMLEKADLILAVSEQFEKWLKENYPEHESKISHLTNGIDWNLTRESATGDERDRFGIVSVGGGMPRKRIINICKAAEKLRADGYENIKLIVAGDKGADTDAINAYPFVKNMGIISRDRLLELYHQNKLFIQDSCFETFGLAPLEALLSGADILVSECCGALSVLTEYEDSDVIHDPENIDEIASKIERSFQNDNHTRLIVELDKESTSWKKRAAELLEIAAGLINTEKQ